MLDPLMPRDAEVREHKLTHLPFRSWCRHCVRGRGKEMAHFKTKDERGVPEFHLDFAFMGDEQDPGKTVPMVVVRERDTRMTMAAAAPSKSTGNYIAKRVAAFSRTQDASRGTSW